MIHVIFGVTDDLVWGYMSELAFDSLKDGDIIDNYENYQEPDGSTECDDEEYKVLYDRSNSTLDEGFLIVDVIKDNNHIGSRVLKREEFDRKRMRAYRE